MVHFFRQVVGVAAVDKEVLSARTADYQNWVDAHAHNHGLPIEWAEKGVRKEDHVLPWLRRMTRANRYGVYFIFKSMEQGSTFRITVPKYPTADPNYRILAHQKSRFTHYYFYIRDEVLGPMVIRVASFFPFQTTIPLITIASAVFSVTPAFCHAVPLAKQNSSTRSETERPSISVRALGSRAAFIRIYPSRSATAAYRQLFLTRPHGKAYLGIVERSTSSAKPIVTVWAAG